jgi:hypothetical protein
MVQGFVTGLGSVDARVEEEYKERRSRALDERSIACSAVEVEASRIRGQSLFDGLILVSWTGKQMWQGAQSVLIIEVGN